MEWLRAGCSARSSANRSRCPRNAPSHRHRRLRCAGLHPSQRRGASRPEARKHHGGRPGRHQADRFRHRRQGRRAAPDLRKPLPGDGHARLHFARAGEGQARRRPQRHLLAGRDALRDADRPDSLQGANPFADHERPAAGNPIPPREHNPAISRSCRKSCTAPWSGSRRTATPRPTSLPGIWSISTRSRSRTAPSCEIGRSPARHG